MKKFTAFVLFIVAGLTVYAQTAETESNNSFATANFITRDNVITGNITAVNDVDYFVSHPTVDGTLKLYIKATNTNASTGYLYLTVFGSSKSSLTARYISGSSSIAAGATVFDTITLYGRGIDSTFFKLESTTSFSYELKYELEDVSTSDAEPNNSFTLATAIDQKQNTSGHIKYLKDGQVDNYDFYRARTSYDGIFKVYITATNTSGISNYCYISVFGSNKSQLAAIYVSGSSSIQAGATVSDSITLYGRGVDSVFFKIESSGTFSYNFNYDVIETLNNDTEPNNSFTTAIPILQNETKTGHIKYINNGVIDDYDYYSSKLADDGTLKIYLSASNTGSVNSYCYFTLYGSNKGQLTGKYIGTNSVNPGITVFDTITLRGRGADSVFFRFEASGAYSYSLKYDITDLSTRDAEPNNSFTTSIAINQNEIKTGHIKYINNGVTDDYDYYRSKLLDDGTLKIYLSATNTGPVNSYCYFTVYGSSKAQLTGKYIGTNSVNPGITVFDTITLRGRGVDSIFYRFEASGTYSYSLKYEILDVSAMDSEPNNSFTTGLPIKLNETKSGHIKYINNGVVDDYDYYRAITSDDGTLKIYVSAINTGETSSWLYLSVYGSNQGVLSAEYITRVSSVLPGAKIADTITVKGIGVDTVYFRMEASGTYSYTLNYDIIDKSASDPEPNNTFATAIKTDMKQVNMGHLMYKAKGLTDQSDYYLTPVSTKGDLRIITELTNVSGTANWVYVYAYNKAKTIVFSQYVKKINNLPSGQLIRDTMVIKCTVLDTVYLRWTAGGITNYKFSMEMVDRAPYANMTHERLGNTVGFRPQLANADKFIWDFGDATSSTQKYPIKTYPIGYYLTKLIATNTACNFKDSAITAIEVKGVEYFTPDSSGVGGDCIFKIFGGGLDSSTKVRLIKGTTVLTPLQLETSKHNIELHAIFDFHLVDEGTYDVEIEIKGEPTFVYPGGFKLKAFRYPYTWSEIVSPTRMRTNLNTSMKLVVGNTGNVMASGVLVAVIWPKSIDLKFDTKWFKPPTSGNYSIITADTTFNFKWEDIQPFYSDTFNTVTAIDTFNLQPYDGYMRLILIPKIAAGGTYEIPLIAKTKSTGTKDFITYTFKPNIFGSCGSGSWMDASENMAVECADGLDKLVSMTPVLEKSPVRWLTKATKGTTKHMANLGQIMGATYNYATGLTPDIYSSLPADFNSNVDAGNIQVGKALLDVGIDVALKKGGENFMKGQTENLNKWIAKNPNATASSIDFAIDNINNINDVRNFIKSARTLYKNGKDLNTLASKLQRLEQLVKDCPELKAQLEELKKNLNQDMTIRDPKHTKTSSVTSFDPNEIIGPVGQGTEQYVSKRERQQFTITFENKKTALAAAQIVTVYDTLDFNRFDLNSFEFTDFTIANKTYNVPKGRQQFVLQDSLSATMRVRINGAIQVNTGVVTWQFTAIDPATGDIPVFEGFLPPDNNVPEGEGSVSFTVLPKQTLTDGNIMKNRASIIFDQNEPILTNTWQNIVDAQPPSSTLTATRVMGSPEINLTLSGSDAASGIGYYVIYMQETGGEWLAIGNAFGETETVIADSSKQYNFYVLANDNVGNTELKNPGVEATVGINELIKGKGSYSLGPNPADDAVYIGGLKRSCTFVIRDVTGKVVLSGNVSETNNIIDIQQLANGMYFLSVYSNGGFESLKLLKYRSN